MAGWRVFGWAGGGSGGFGGWTCSRSWSVSRPVLPQAAGSLACGTHLCGLYSSEEGQVRQALLFLAEGFRPGSVSYLVGTADTRGRILAGLEREHPALETAIAEGRLVISDYAESAAAQLVWWETRIAQAVRRGATLVRAIGDASAFIQAASRKELFEYEAEYDRRIAHRFPVVTMCQYDVRQFSGMLVVNALMAHPDCFGQSAEPGSLRDALAALGRLALIGLVPATACSRERSAESPGGSLEAQWIGSDTGKLVAPAVAEWCGSLRVLELRAVHGDTGIALALYPADSLAAGDYPAVQPERGESTRPSAAVVMRWFAETSIRGFRGDSGSVTLATIGPGVGAGSFARATPLHHRGQQTQCHRLLPGPHRPTRSARLRRCRQGARRRREPDLEEEVQETPD